MNFHKAKILAIFSVYDEESKTNNIMLLANGDKLKSSVFIVDSEMQRIDRPELNGLQIKKVADTLYRRHLFGIDASQNLIAINVDFASKGVTPYRILDIAKHYGSESSIVIDDKQIWLLHKSGTLSKIQSFDGEMRLEDYGAQENYLVWK